jgi:hypothetical protein
MRHGCAHAADAPGEHAHDVHREVRHFIDHERKVRASITESSQASFTRAVDERGAVSIIDMKPIASFGPTTSITRSPITISIEPDCKMYMHWPASPWLNTVLPAPKLIVAPALFAN